MHRRHAGRFEGRELVSCRALATGDHSAGMAHALARRRGHTRNVGHHRLGDVLANEFGTRLLVAAADLTHHDDAFGLRIGLKQGQNVHEIHATHRVATDPHTRALTKPKARGLEHGFVGQRARARHNADLAGLVDEARHNADLRLPRRDHTGAVRSDEPRGIPF